MDTLNDLIAGLAARGAAPAVLAFGPDGAARLAYRDLAQEVGRLARGLLALGLRRAESVVLCAPNSPGWIAACLGILRAGGVAVPVDAQAGDDSLRHILKDSGARWAFTSQGELPRLQSVAQGMGFEFLLLDGPSRDDAMGLEAPAAKAPGALPKVEPEDPAALFYTSGTTGPPKGVPLSHRNLAFQIDTLIEADFIRPDDTVLLPLPLHHVYPFVMGMLAPLAFGLPIVLPQALTGPELLRALREGEVSLIIGVPRFYAAFFSGLEAQAKHRGPLFAKWFQSTLRMSAWLRGSLGLGAGRLLFYPLHRRLGPRVRLLASGGSALDPDLAQRLEAMGWKVAIGYGLTETAPLLCLNLPPSPDLSSVGPPIPGVAIRIDAASGPAGQARMPGQGEIQAKGPNVFSGYRELPDKTKEAFSEDGWFRTGDLGFFDKAGAVHVLGRISAIIVTESGENIQPEALEEIYQTHPFILEMGILGHAGRLVAVAVPDLGEIRKSGRTDVEAALRGAIREQARGLPSYQRLTDVVLSRELLPRTRLGKIRRHLLADLYQTSKTAAPEAAAPRPMTLAEMAEEDRHLLQTHTAAEKVWELLTRRYPDRRLTLETSPALDLGIDSLEWLNLSLEIGQAAGVELSESAIAHIETVRDLLTEAARASRAGQNLPAADPLTEPEKVLTAEQKRWLRPLPSWTKPLVRWLYALNRLGIRLFFSLRVEGLDRIPEGPVILAPNHNSYLDPFALAAALDIRHLREVYWAAWTGAAFNTPLRRLVSRLSQSVPIDPQNAFISGLAFGAAVLHRDKCLIWFPEGQRSRDGRLQPLRPGIGLLLERFGCPVIPVAIRGTHEAWPVDRKWPRRHPVRVHFGDPIAPEELLRLGRGQEPHMRITEGLTQRLEALIREVDGQTAAPSHRTPGR